jgi:hypothetical protein
MTTTICTVCFKRKASCFFVKAGPFRSCVSIFEHIGSLADRTFPRYYKACIVTVVRILDVCIGFVNSSHCNTADPLNQFNSVNAEKSRCALLRSRFKYSRSLSINHRLFAEQKNGPVDEPSV